MKQIITCLLSLCLFTVSFAQSSQQSLLSQKWKYLGVEEFGVVTPPDSMKKNDWVQFNNDGTYKWIKDGKTSSGTWKLNEAAKSFSITDGASQKTLRYNLKKVTEAELTIEYQTPDLVRTRYRYAKATE